MMGQFLMSTRIYTGEASLEEIEHLGLKRAYIICDPFMEKCGRAGELAAMLNGAGAETRILRGRTGSSQRCGCKGHSGDEGI